MLSSIQAEEALLKQEPSVKVQEFVVYRDVYLFRVQHASQAERDYDPFFSVNVATGEVKDFSVLHDGDISEITELFMKNKKRR